MAPGREPQHKNFPYLPFNFHDIMGLPFFLPLLHHDSIKTNPRTIYMVVGICFFDEMG
jgi:hypothetical protein